MTQYKPKPKNNYDDQLKQTYDKLLTTPDKVRELVEEAQHYLDTLDISDNPYEEVIIGIMEVVQDQKRMSYKQWKVINYFVTQTRKALQEENNEENYLTW